MSKGCPAIFPALNIDHLKIMAESLITYYDYLQTAMLYLAPPEYRYGVKYIVVFLPFKTKTAEDTINKRMRILEEMISNFGYPPEWDEHIKNFYNDLPPDGFLKEWDFLVQAPPGMTEKFSCTLFHRTRLPLDSPVIYNLMKNAHQEIEDVYSSILKVGFSEKYGDQSELRKKAALETFDSEPSKFQYIARVHLENTDLYRVYSKPRRSIVGEILKKIVFSNGYGKFGGQKLYEVYKATNRG